MSPEPQRPTLGSRLSFVWWPNAARPWYLVAAALTGLVFKLSWTGSGYLRSTDGEAVLTIDDRWGTIIGILAAFLVASGNWVLRQSARDWSRIAVADAERAPLEAETFAPSWRATLLCTTAGLLMGVLQLWASGDLTMMFEARPPTLLAASALVLLFWTLAAQVGGNFLIVIRGFYRLGLRIEPDPLRIESLTPFSVVGLRVLATNATLSALLILLTGLGNADLLGLAVPLGFSALVSVLCFLLPQLGARQSLRRAKRRMLAQLDERLEELEFPRPRALHSDTVSKVADLAALRAQISAAPDWPVTGVGWLRFTVVLLLPAASWGLDKLITHLLS